MPRQLMAPRLHQILTAVFIHLPLLLRALRRIPCVDSEEQVHAYFHTEAAMNIAAVYQHVTQSIIAELEQGAAPWVKPWKGGGRVGIMPANAITGHHYRGINVPILWHVTDTNGFPSHAWLTFKQALDKGAHVRKAAKGTKIVFTKQLTVRRDDAEDEERQISILRAFTVFNVAQVEGLDAPNASLGQSPPPAGAADAFAAATGADIRHGGDRACFVPSLDFVALPAPRRSRPQSITTQQSCMS